MAKRMKMVNNGTFQQCIDCVDIAGRSTTRGVQQGWCGKMSYFRAKCVNMSKTVADTSKVTINI